MSSKALVEGNLVRLYLPRSRRGMPHRVTIVNKWGKVIYPNIARAMAYTDPSATATILSVGRISALNGAGVSLAIAETALREALPRDVSDRVVMMINPRLLLEAAMVEFTCRPKGFA